MEAKERLSPDSKRAVSFFTNLLHEHTSGPEALNWGSRHSQELRFQILAEIGISKGASLLDVGCGLGDFHAWQKNQGLELKYFGVDITPAMVAAAQKRFADAHFQVADLLEKQVGVFDYVIASGIFYLRQNDPQRYLENVVEKLFKNCRVGIAFNSLSNWSHRQDSGEFYADPLRTVDFCRSLSPFVTLRHDYHLGDFTIYIRRSPKKL
jgi:SAM-dependent methyltransferase